ncbi:MAG: hypothetical protein ABI321_06280 [Polyangia bacterium]
MARDDRWAWLEGVRRTSLEDALAHEAARVLADELFEWPPPIAWDDPRVEAELASLFVPFAPGPTLAAIDLGFRFARWELERQFDAIDHAMRNDVVGALDGRDRLMTRFLWRWVPEWLLELKERSGPRITRAHLLVALDDAEARLRGRTLGAQ